jgi:putative ABC transport system permease protein
MRKLWHAFFEGSKAAMQAITAHGMRSALTTLGIIIGVGAVITVVAIMESLSANITDQLDDLGSDMVTLSAHTPQEQEMLGLSNKISYDDFLLLKNKTKNVKDMTPVMTPFSLGSSVQYGRNNTQTRIVGTDSSYQAVIHVYPELGRFLSESDDLRRRRVVFIGTSTAKKLNMPDDPIGEFISLSGDWFRVIGLAEERGSFLGFDQDNYIIAPFSTIRSLNGSQATDNIQIMFRPETGANLKSIKDNMRQILRNKYKLTGDDVDHFEFSSAEKTKEQFNNITTSVTLVASGVVGISLLVGGIGIMNIMLVSVTERTKEIGIAKALGATPQFILFQFLIEALLLSLLGGIIGLLLGYGLASLVALVMPGTSGVMVPMWAVGLSLGFTTAIGVIFGLAPAIKAAKLNPVDALRYE